METETENQVGERTQYTPGPWKLVQPLAQAHWVATEIVADDGNPEVIATAQPIGHTQERNANARLIAAAPELLTALRNATDALQFCPE